MRATGSRTAHHVIVPGIDHQVAAPFWDFMTSSGTVYEDGAYLNAALFPDPYYATGYPITEAYWADVLVGGTERLVLMQCFERRCLTYTPGNPEGWQVEAGNVGQHYHTWRYPEEAEIAGDAGSRERVVRELRECRYALGSRWVWPRRFRLCSPFRQLLLPPAPWKRLRVILTAAALYPYSRSWRYRSCQS